ncbi:MAG: DUF4249 family protein [Rhodothermaceae bacterium]|nr:DUF4249 family protein [Rhodothermaceae bacterium]MYG68974.1 DUF4249 family protein [Rhodothermaceae bacterium]MYJ45943.1 DUF4249 family protein [Rhodothermaceae bacterium]
MRYLLNVLFFLTLLSCETIIEIAPPDYEPKVVVTSHFNPDSIWSVALHQSSSIGIKQDISKQYALGASIVIMSGSSLVDSLNYVGNGLYKSAKFKYPLPKTLYTLTVDIPGQPRLQASSSAPPRTPVTDYRIELQGSVVETPIDHIGLYNIWIEFEDVPGTNMYEIGIYRYTAKQVLGGLSVDSVYQRQDSFESLGLGWYCGFQSALEVDVEFRGGPGVSCNRLVVTDRTFSGQKYEWSGTLQLSFSADERQADNEALLLLTSYSNDYVEYARTLTENQNSGSFFEPISVYSNVDGGLGIFAGYTNTSLILSLSK